MPLNTNFRTCDSAKGDLFAANNGRYTQLRGHLVTGKVSGTIIDTRNGVL